MSNEVVVPRQSLISDSGALRGPPGPTGPLYRLLLTDAFDQFARNFVLNDLSEEQSVKRLEAGHRAITYPLARREPRRRNSTLGRIHQARLSLRRLRSTLRTFGDLFEAGWSAPLQSELSWYAGVLGEVRDLDVLRTSISTSLGLMGDPAIRSFVTARLDQLVTQAQDRCAVEKSTKRYACVVDEVSTLTRSICFEATGRPEHGELSRLLTPAWRDVKKAHRKARDHPNNDHLHQLRIELKRLQCGCEVVGTVEAPALRVARAAETAQKKLGIVHDQAATRQWLRALVVTEPDLKYPLRGIEDFHNRERKVARRDWGATVDDVHLAWRSWGDLIP